MVLEEDKVDLEVRQRADSDRPNDCIGCRVWPIPSPGAPVTSDTALP
jgi:hypothetical protein